MYLLCGYQDVCSLKNERIEKDFQEPHILHRCYTLCMYVHICNVVNARLTDAISSQISMLGSHKEEIMYKPIQFLL